MTRSKRQRLRQDQPATYRIKIQGRLNETWEEWFGDTTITVKTDGAIPVTILLSTVADQADLHGVLARIRDIGLPLLLVQCVGYGEADEGETPSQFAVDGE